MLLAGSRIYLIQLVLLRFALTSNCSHIVKNQTVLGLEGGLKDGIKGTIKEQSTFSKRVSVFALTDYVKSNKNQKEGKESPVSKKTSQHIPSKDDKRIIFEAAKDNDTLTIKKYRENGYRLKDLSKKLWINETTKEEVILVSYAAAYGSFDVLENLLVNGDYWCRIGSRPENVLCVHSSISECDAQSDARKGVLMLIDLTYGKKCVSVATMSFVKKYGVQKMKLPPAPLMPIAKGLAECDRYLYFVSVKSSLRQGYSHICGGVLIQKNVVLTAAHCLRKGTLNPRPMVYVGAQTVDERKSECDSDYEPLQTKDMKIHPGWYTKYSRRGYGNGFDVALLILNRESKHDPIKIRSDFPLGTGEKVHRLGLGRQSEGSAYSSQLQINKMTIRELQTCRLQDSQPFGQDVFCIKGSTGPFCEGDDGGPVILRGNSAAKDRLVGIAPVLPPSEYCECPEVPCVVANISMVKEWIDNILENTEELSAHPIERDLVQTGV